MNAAAASRAVIMAVALVAAAACADPPPSSGAPSAVSAQAQKNQPATEESAMTPITITVGDRTLAAQLTDNPTARDLIGQLPLTLTFRDLNGVEKIGRLPRPLTMDGVPDGDDPQISDIGYYAPSNNLVLYYGDVGYWTGIVRIGRLTGADLDFIENQSDGFDATIDRG